MCFYLNLKKAKSLKMKNTIFITTALLFSILAFGQNKKQLAYSQIPIVYANIVPDTGGTLFFSDAKLLNKNPFYTLSNIRIDPKGSEQGITFDFGNPDFRGTIYYGLFAKELPKYPQTVFFKKNAPIRNGRAEINIANLKGKYDIADWEKSAKAGLGYRITNYYGKIIYDGKINIEGTGPFKTGISIIEGPFVNVLTDTEATISFITNKPCSPFIEIDGEKYRSSNKMMNMTGDVEHEITIHHLTPETNYKYQVHYNDYVESHHFTTSPAAGSRTKFVFAFTSDSRAGMGGGERNIYGTNAYVMKKMAALALDSDAVFFQFTGDLITGYSSSIDEMNLQYANWKRNLEAFRHYIPFYVGMGNHEALVNIFDDGSEYGVQIDKWPFENQSAEAIFSRNFVNPVNGPESEDGSEYDPKPNQTDFPPYNENVYFYIYDNVAMIVLNSNYWYAPSVKKIPEIGGNPHGYLMDNQLHWLKETIVKLDKNPNIDHIFVTVHTPAFPNGGHSGDDMWYNGNNYIRPTIAGEPVKKGIIERRDEFLNVIINESTKVVALLSGDEHNYSRMKITRKTPIYPENYTGKKLKVKRPFIQITNGSAGAPYYGQEQLPWSESVEMFSTQYALMLFYVEGKKVSLKVVNPDTLEEIEEVVLKK